MLLHQKHKYCIQAVVLRKSWPLSQSQWSFVQSQKDNEQNEQNEQSEHKGNVSSISLLHYDCLLSPCVLMLCLLCLFSVYSLKKNFEPWDFSSSSGLFVCIKRQRINSSDNKKRAAKLEKSLTLPDGVNEDYCCVCFVCIVK